MSDLEKFRAEVNTWLKANAPQSIVGTMQTDDEGIWGGRKAVYPNPDAKRWLEIMAERGWTAPAWPREYGGGGLAPGVHTHGWQPAGRTTGRSGHPVDGG